MRAVMAISAPRRLRKSAEAQNRPENTFAQLPTNRESTQENQPTADPLRTLELLSPTRNSDMYKAAQLSLRRQSLKLTKATTRQPHRNNSEPARTWKHQQ